MLNTKQCKIIRVLFFVYRRLISHVTGATATERTTVVGP